MPPPTTLPANATRAEWAETQERGANWGPALMAFIYRQMGRTLCLIVMVPVMLYFFATGARQRRASLSYLRRVWPVSGRPGRPGLWHSFRHFFAFGESMIDRFAAWIGQIDRKDVEAIDGAAFDAMRADKRGSLILSAHVGATEIVRAIATRYQPRRINIVVHTRHAAHFNAVIEKVAPQSLISLIQASEFDLASSMAVSAAIERGEWVVMMGDRLAVKKGGRAIMVEFLGEPAPFPEGPFTLAAVLHCPVHTLFCIRQGKRYKAHVALLTDGLEARPRSKRGEAIEALAQAFARTVERLVQEAPYQWFNFYDYWRQDVGIRARASVGED